LECRQHEQYKREYLVPVLEHDRGVQC
jgi:hypothetical protein